MHRSSICALAALLVTTTARLRSARRGVSKLERFPFRLIRRLHGSWSESALDSTFVAFPIGKPVSTFPGHALRWPFA